jgi:hypothetical protein
VRHVWEDFVGCVIRAGGRLDLRCGEVMVIRRPQNPRGAQRDRTCGQALTSGTKTARKSVYIPVGVLVFQTRPVKLSFEESKGAEPYVAQKSDLIILPVFVLSQIERPGRAIACGTARRLHLQYVCKLLSTGYAERAREAASSSSLLNLA